MNLTIEGRAKTMPDIQRSWMWELLVPSIADVTGGIMGDVEDLIIRTRSAVIPARGNEPITSEFIGMKQFFPGKPTFGNTFAVNIEETENQIVHKAFTYWQNLIYNIAPNDPTGGQSLRTKKRDVAKDVYLLMYTYHGTTLEKKIRFYNSFIQNIGDVAMAYGNNESVKYDVTFQFDFWELA